MEGRTVWEVSMSEDKKQEWRAETEEQMTLLPGVRLPEDRDLPMTEKIEPLMEAELKSDGTLVFPEDEPFPFLVFSAVDYSVFRTPRSRYPAWFFTPALENEEENIKRLMSEYESGSWKEEDELEDYNRKDMARWIREERESLRLIREARPRLLPQAFRNLMEAYMELRSIIKNKAGWENDLERLKDMNHSWVRQFQRRRFRVKHSMTAAWIVKCRGAIDNSGEVSWVDIHAAYFIAANLLGCPESWWEPEMEMLRKTFQMMSPDWITNLGIGARKNA
jgi:hypothetical protein